MKKNQTARNNIIYTINTESGLEGEFVHPKLKQLNNTKTSSQQTLSCPCWMSVHWTELLQKYNKVTD